MNPSHQKSQVLMSSGYKAYYPKTNTFPEDNNHLQHDYSYISMSCIFLQHLVRLILLFKSLKSSNFNTYYG
jgi:hypothetical protein